MNNQGSTSLHLDYSFESGSYRSVAGINKYNLSSGGRKWQEVHWTAHDKLLK